MTIKIWPISAFSDNYIWTIVQSDLAVVVDPGDATPVLAYLREHGLTLTNILLTHHHADHVGGVAELVEKTGATVYGPAGPTIPCRNVTLKEGDDVNLSPFGQFSVLEVPGHTLDHIAYFGQVDGRDVLFCGDTLFATDYLKEILDKCNKALINLKNCPTIRPSIVLANTLWATSAGHVPSNRTTLIWNNGSATQKHCATTTRPPFQHRWNMNLKPIRS